MALPPNVTKADMPHPTNAPFILPQHKVLSSTGPTAPAPSSSGGKLPGK